MPQSNANDCPQQTPDACRLAASGQFCLACGRTLRSGADDDLDARIDDALVVPDQLANVDHDPADVNYWALLMHDIEIEDAGDLAPSGRFAFYGGSKPKPRR